MGTVMAIVGLVREARSIIGATPLPEQVPNPPATVTKPASARRLTGLVTRCGASESGLAGRDMAKPVNKSAQAWVYARHLQHVVIHGEAIGLRMEALLSVAATATGRLADPDRAGPVAPVY